jgi:TonB family protein
VIRPGLSPESVGWVTSVAVHVAGGLALWVMAGAVPTINPNLAGQTSRAELLATWQEPVEPQQLEELPTIDAQVLITPREARVAEHTFVRSATDVSRPSPAELALVERLMTLPPPAARRRVTQPAQSPLVSDMPRPREVPYRSLPAPKIPVADASVPPSAPENLSVGTDVESPPHLLKNLPPTYPAQAVINQWEGTVLLRLHIAADGKVTKVEVISSSGHHILDVEAIRSIRNWRFTPAKRNGQAVAATVRLPVQFVLNAD